MTWRLGHGTASSRQPFLFARNRPGGGIRCECRCLSRCAGQVAAVVHVETIISRTGGWV